MRILNAYVFSISLDLATVKCNIFLIILHEDELSLLACFFTTFSPTKCTVSCFFSPQISAYIVYCKQMYLFFFFE